VDPTSYEVSYQYATSGSGMARPFCWLLRVLLLRSTKARQRCVITIRANPSLKALIEAMTVDTLVAKDRLKFNELIDDSWV
jgi:hypothetical protein